MKRMRVVVAVAIAALVPMLTAGTAQAELSGPCTASGTLNGKTYNPKTQDSAVIPRAGTVHWRGTVADGSGKRPIAGGVWVKLPWPIEKVQINGSWGKSSDRYANNGEYDYDLPMVLVGPKFMLFGHHTERSVTCAGTMEVQLSGSKWKNPALIASLLLTIVALVNVSIVVRVKTPRL